jgi:hypothetical protein
VRVGRKNRPRAVSASAGAEDRSGEVEDIFAAASHKREILFRIRQSGWFHPEIYSLLFEFRTTFCIYENGSAALNALTLQRLITGAGS